MKDCAFCKIVAGTIPANKIYEDDTASTHKRWTQMSRGPCVETQRSKGGYQWDAEAGAFSDLSSAAIRPFGPLP